MINRRRSGGQATPRNRSAGKSRSGLSALQVVPRNVASAAEQSMAAVRPNLLRYIDLHPALAVLTGVAIIALVSVIYLTQVTTVTNANYTLQALQSEHTQLLREQQNLQLQIARAQSLTNIEKIAREKLQMVPIGDQYEYIQIAPGPLASAPSLPTPGP
jgi:cell division protein FtsL